MSWSLWRTQRTELGSSCSEPSMRSRNYLCQWVPCYLLLCSSPTKYSCTHLKTNVADLLEFLFDNHPPKFTFQYFCYNRTPWFLHISKVEARTINIEAYSRCCGWHITSLFNKFYSIVVFKFLTYVNSFRVASLWNSSSSLWDDNLWPALNIAGPEQLIHLMTSDSCPLLKCLQTAV